MTKEEMLSQLGAIRDHCKSMIPLDEPESVWKKDVAALDMAISALRQQEIVTNRNEPLTPDDLRKMDGEPVWWWNKSAKPVCTICVWDRFMDEPMFANYDWQSEYTLQLSKYKWLKKCGYKPYRQKPEEDDCEH